MTGREIPVFDIYDDRRVAIPTPLGPIFRNVHVAMIVMRWIIQWERARYHLEAVLDNSKIL